MRRRRHRHRRSRRATTVMSRPSTFVAPISAASTTIAVPCWSSCITGQSSASTSASFDLEAARRGDVLEVDRAERRPQPHQGLDDLVGILGVQHDRDRVQAGERLEQRALALHHRQRRRGADVTQAEHRAAVADHGHHPVRPGVAGGQGVVGGDRAADLCDARGVGDRQRALGVQRRPSARRKASRRRGPRRSPRLRARWARIFAGGHFPLLGLRVRTGPQGTALDL